MTHLVPTRWRPTKHKYQRRVVALRYLVDLVPGRVLDAPCGEGLLAGALAERGWEVWTCDLDPTVAGAKAGARFDAVDLNERLPYADDLFDAIVSLEGIEHLATPATCLGEFARVLRPGGRLVLTTPNVNNMQSRYHYAATGRFSGFRTLTRRALERQRGPVAWHITVPYLPTLLHTMTRAGLEVERVDVTMVKRAQWLWLPVAAPLWLAARQAPAGSVARLLGSWRLLLGRSVVVRAVKRAAEATRGSG